MTERYFEDFAVGQTFKSAEPLRVDKADVFDFARKYDPQPFHLDEAAAQQSIFEGLSASGWHTAALTMRLITESDFKAAGGTIGLGFDGMRWPIPVRPGDELRIESEIMELRPSQSRPDRGLMKVRTRTLNQNGDIVQELTANVMVPRRPKLSR